MLTACANPGGKTAIAFHEAGHALACTWVGSDIKFITLAPEVAWAGGQIMRRDTHDRGKNALIAAAGPIAEALYLTATEGGDLGDWLIFTLQNGGQNDYANSCGIFENTELVQALVDALGSGWRRIADLADALVRRTRVEGPDAEAILRAGELVAA